MAVAQHAHATNHADVVGEIYTDARIDALNTVLVERGISGEQIIAILPEAGQAMVKPTPPRFRVLYRTA